MPLRYRRTGHDGRRRHRGIRYWAHIVDRPCAGVVTVCKECIRDIKFDVVVAQTQGHREPVPDGHLVLHKEPCARYAFKLIQCKGTLEPAIVIKSLPVITLPVMVNAGHHSVLDIAEPEATRVTDATAGERAIECNNATVCKWQAIAKITSEVVATSSQLTTTGERVLETDTQLLLVKRLSRVKINIAIASTARICCGLGLRYSARGSFDTG